MAHIPLIPGLTGCGFAIIPAITSRIKIECKSTEHGGLLVKNPHLDVLKIGKAFKIRSDGLGP